MKSSGQDVFDDEIGTAITLGDISPLLELMWQWRPTPDVGKLMLSFSRLDTLPRSAKMAILVVGDSVMAAVAVWFAVPLRAGGIPVLPGLYVAMVTVLVVLLVPTVAIVCGYHRL